jgi:hypothetical protein
MIGNHGAVARSGIEWRTLCEPCVSVVYNFSIRTQGGNSSMEQNQTQQDLSSWDLEADIVVVGSGAAGLPAAIKAADAGASVIVVETNYDVGGHAIISGGNLPLGGGTSAQKKYGIHDSPDIVFSDLTDWTIVQANGWPDFRYNDREVMRAFADHCAPTYEFLLENGVQFKDIPPDNQGGHNLGNSAPRENHTFWTKGAGLESPNNRAGTGVIRPLENSARAKGQIFIELQDDESHPRRATRGPHDRHRDPAHAANFAGRNHSNEELSLRRKYRQHKAGDEYPCEESGDHRHRRHDQQCELPAYVRSETDRGAHGGRRAL